MRKALGDIPEQEVCDARERMINSATFRSAPQLTSFLNYIVRTTLLGRQHEIKGYTIAVEALGRADDFDPVADPIVRVEAGRLRRAIDAYYAGEGAGDPVRIVVERGSYVPQFVRVPVQSTASSEVGSSPGEVSGRQAEPVTGATIWASAPVSAASLVEMQAIPAPDGSASLPVSRSRWAFILALAAVAVLTASLAGYLSRREAVPVSQDARAIETPMTSVGRRQPTIQVMMMRSSDAEINAAAHYYDQQVSDALSRFDDFTVLKTSVGMASAGTPQPTYRVEFNAEPNAAGNVVTSLRLIDVQTDVSSLLAEMSFRDRRSKVSIR